MQSVKDKRAPLWEGVNMTVVIGIFCLFMTLLAITKCLLNEETVNYKIVTSILALGSGFTGFFVVRDMLPSPAYPEINEMYFYSSGTQKELSFCCEFFARNNGDTLCKLEKVEFVLGNTTFELAKSATMVVGMGGGSGGRYGGPSQTKQYIACSTFPQSLPPTNQLFRIIGKGKNSDAEAPHLDSGSVDITFYFSSKKKSLITQRTVPIITNRPIQDMRF